MKLKLLVFFFFILFHSLVFAQNTKSDTIFAKMDRLGVLEVIQGKAMTEEKVVGASRSVKKLEDLPVTVYVVTAEDILKNGYTTLVDVLKMVPGIRVSKPGSGTSGEIFLMRGLEGNVYTKILLNNLPIQPSASSTLGIGEQLPIAQVDRIEIIYGPSSAVYGADAMAGVINIITKSVQSTSFAAINVLAGEYGYRHLNFMAGGKLGRDKDVVQYSIFGNRGVRADQNIKQGEYRKVYSPLRAITGADDNISDAQLEALLQNPQFSRSIKSNFASQVPFFQDSYVNPTLNELPQESYLIGANIKYRGLQFSYQEMYRADHSSIGRTPAYHGYQNPETKIGEKMQLTSLNYSNAWKKLTLTANLMYLRERYDKQSSFATNYNYDGKSYIYQASDDIFGEAVVNYNLTKKIELTSGVSYRLASALPLTREFATPFNPSDYVPFTGNKPKTDPLFGDFGVNPVNLNNLGAFFQAYFSSKRWNIVLGWRYDRPSNYADQDYTRIAAMYKITPKTSFRISSGYAFKAPPLTTSYYSVAIEDREFDTLALKYTNLTGEIAYQVIPSPNLAPEQLGSVDVGLRYVPTPNIYLDVSIFGNVLTNLIVAKLDASNNYKTAYPKASIGKGNVVRYYENSTNTYAVLFGFQAVLRARNLIPAIGLNTNFAYTYQAGSETLEENGGTLNNYRQVPHNTLQWSISFNPIKKLYFNFDNVMMSGWYRKYISSDINLGRGDDVFKAFIKGYYTLDMAARYTFNKNLATFVKITNMFDTQYGGLSATGFDVDLKYSPQLGRNVQIGVSFKID